jgi:hypothetical protein
MGGRSLFALALLPLLFGSSYGQAVLAQPFSAQLSTDPGVGNVQGIQRFGRPLKTDPDQGEGFSYHVYPVARESASTLLANARLAQLPQSLRFADSDSKETDEIQNRLEENKLKLRALGPNAAGRAAVERDIQLDRMQLELNELRAQALAPTATWASPYTTPWPAPFDATAGLRNFATPQGAAGNLNDPVTARALVAARAIAVPGDRTATELLNIYHQPIIQIRVRVVEVARGDGLAVQSILDYAAQGNANTSLTTGRTLNTANGGNENFRGSTNFTIPGLITNATTGSGMILNLTAEHINYLASLLATEFSADIVTAPEVVTLNGQNVEFVSGSKLPFALGQNVIQGTNNNIQQFFYKHIGTYVSVTPKIVNFGFHGEGRGERAIVASDVVNWNLLVESMLDPATLNLDGDFRERLVPYANNNRPIPFDLKTDILKSLNQYSKSDFIENATDGEGQPVQIMKLAGLEERCLLGECGTCRDWKPEDCTVDLKIVVRLSEQGTQDLQIGEQDATVAANLEQNIRAVANVIQVKSGNGVVMAGLIGTRESEVVDKVPVLGDIPIAGFLFRSKQTLRQKTEVLVFVEAEVLPPEANLARARSAHDFRLGADYVHGELLDNPLEIGMHRVGFGSYLPPCSHGEGVFWERLGRKIRKSHTHIDDAFE